MPRGDYDRIHTRIYCHLYVNSSDTTPVKYGMGYLVYLVPIHRPYGLIMIIDFLYPIALLILIGIAIYLSVIVVRYKRELVTQEYINKRLRRDLEHSRKVSDSVNKLTLPIRWHVHMERKEEWLTRRVDICELLGISFSKYDSMRADPKSDFPEAIIVTPGVRAWLRTQLSLIHI